MSQLADFATALIDDCWYALALSAELDRTPRSRTIAGKAMVYYRTQSGEVAVLRDRCPHRAFPLSKGYLDGDLIVCNYHGLAFEPNGACARKPSDPSNSAPVRVQAIPFFERQGILWVWPGDPAAAAAENIPDLPWMVDPDWSCVSGYLNFPANYIALHENLMDLTHFAFLHAGNIGTPAYAAAPFNVAVRDRVVNIRRVLRDAPLPELLAVPTGLGTRAVTRETDTYWISPGLNLTESIVEDPDDPTSPSKRFRFRIIHLITPETQRTTHNFWAIARDFSQENPAIDAHLRVCAARAFQEDLDALGWIQSSLDREGAGPDEIHLASDRGGLLVRREMKRRAMAQASRSPRPPA